MRSRFFHSSFVVLVVLVFVCASFLHAQETTADIVGTVSDTAGKVIAGATVTVTHKGTDATRTVVTGPDGSYTITTLNPGRYDLSVEAPNFSKTVIRDFELNVGVDRSFNVELKPGQITEVVEVTGEGALIQPTRSDIDTTVSPKEIENLPLLNRTFAGLTVIAPEARPVANFDPTKTRVGTIAFNGGDGRQVNVNVDGGDNKDNVVGSLLQNFSYESIQEFQVLQHKWTADQGRSVGGVVNVITKSGTNEFHGSAFFNYRGEETRARHRFDPAEKPYFARQEFGGSVGGPIVQDKAFFFVAYERFRERQNVAVPDSIADDIQLIPGNQFVPLIPQPYDDTLFSTKIDWRISENQSFFGRFAYQGIDSPNDQVSNPAATDLTGGNVATTTNYSFVGNHTYTFSPTLLNQFVFHFQDFVNEILPNPDGVGLTLNFPGMSIGQNANTPQATLERKFQFRDDVSWVKDEHSMKFGVNYIYTKLDGFFFFGTQGYSITFAQTPETIVAQGGFNRPGLVSQIQFSDGAASHLQKIDQLAFYFQDDWRIRPNFTLNLGLRWDANIGNLPKQDQNRTMLILRDVDHPLANALTDDQEKLRRTTPSWTEFQPRIGFAWDPWNDGKTVIRGGYGIFYDQLFQNLTLFSQTQSEPEIFQTAINLQPPDPFLASFIYGVTPLPPVPADFNFGTLVQGSFGRINDPDATEPYVQKFQIGFQRELSPNMSISSDYVHTLGLHEPRYLNINPRIQSICNPAFPGSTPASPQCVRGANTRLLDAAFIASGFPMQAPAGVANPTPAQMIPRLEQINMFTTNNRSTFDSWATTFKYRAPKILLNASYVLAWSRAWGGQPTASYSGNGIAITPENQFKEGEFGPTRLDERHRIVVSGVFDLPWDIQISSILQYGSPRPFSANRGADLDGDGLTTIDRLCAGVDPRAMLEFALANNTAAITAANPLGCIQAPVNSLRSGYDVQGGTIIGEITNRFFNVDVRVAKTFTFGERYRLQGFVDFYNIFNTENIAIGAPSGAIQSRLGLTAPTSPSTFLQPGALWGPGFGPPVGRPFTASFGARFTF
ncbi:MAG TPA: TonB-dependent receptor [Pyrinomonadaceae bacterium]|nr:TonB-dependent receptor [Pyrinomonadaceae bacterium]